MNATEEGQKARTAKATLVLRQNTARKHAQKYVEALELIGYTVTPPKENQ